MKKKLVLLLVTAMAATTVMAGCGSKDSGSSDSGKKSTKEAKVENDDDTFIVGFDASFPPYGFKDDSGEYVGFDLDLAQEVCDRNNWKLVKQPIDWDSKDAELNSETIDCIWNGFTMNGREDDYTWSDPYIDNKQVVVVRSDSGIDDFAGLKGKHVEVQTDSSALAALEGDQKDLADTFADLNERIAEEREQLGYTVPYILWANYDMDQNAPGEISLNYLGGLLMEKAGISLDGYQKYLKKLQEIYPVITAKIMMDKDGREQKTDISLLSEYHMLEYNNLCDKKNKLWDFFGVSTAVHTHKKPETA